MHSEEQTKFAHEVAERAMSDIRDMLTEGQMLENYEPGYDLVRHDNGWIEIKASHDVRIYISPDCEEEYSMPDDEPSESELERQAENVGIPFWMRV
jgi:hypothetical protein